MAMKRSCMCGSNVSVMSCSTYCKQAMLVCEGAEQRRHSCESNFYTASIARYDRVRNWIKCCLCGVLSYIDFFVPLNASVVYCKYDLVVYDNLQRQTLNFCIINRHFSKKIEILYSEIPMITNTTKCSNI